MQGQAKRCELATGRPTARLEAVGDTPHKTRSGTRVRPARVLVIDDRGVVGAELAQDLRDDRVVAVECGEDALALLDAGQSFDLILCEVLMPGMSGPELLSCLEANHPSQAERLVFMTDRIVSPVVEYLLEGVPNTCLERPFDLEGLRSLIERRIRQPASNTA
jgi:DNA-binding NtrC family response regulator